MHESQWEFYEEPSGSLRTVIADVTIGDVALTLAIETPGNEVWLTEERAGAQQHYRVGRSSIRVRRIDGFWVLIGSFAKWPREVRTVRVELDVPLSGFYDSQAGWLALAPLNAGSSDGMLSWIDQQGGVRETLTLPPLHEMLDSGPTWYGPAID